MVAWPSLYPVTCFSTSNCMQPINYLWEASRSGIMVCVTIFEQRALPFSRYATSCWWALGLTISLHWGRDWAYPVRDKLASILLHLKIKPLPLSSACIYFSFLKTHFFKTKHTAAFLFEIIQCRKKVMMGDKLWVDWPAGESGLRECWPLGVLVDRSTSILEFSFLGEQSPLPRRQTETSALRTLPCLRQRSYCA